MDDLNGKTAFITGGASGIGLGMAIAFARAGMNVAITDISSDQLAIAERKLKTITDNTLALEVDSTDKRSLENAADELEKSFLCPHVVDTPIISSLKERVAKDIATLIEEMAVPTETVGAQVIHAILNQEFYIFCDGTHTRGMLEQRCRDLISAMDRQFPRSTDD